MHDKNTRRVFVLGRGLYRIRYGSDDAGIGPRGLKRVHHADMRDPTYRIQHVPREDHLLNRRLTNPADQMASGGSLRILFWIDADRRQALREAVKKRLG